MLLSVSRADEYPERLRHLRIIRRKLLYDAIALPVVTAGAVYVLLDGPRWALVSVAVAAAVSGIGLLLFYRFYRRLSARIDSEEPWFRRTNPKA
jgi:NADH:ubiquinone oxidoreductase subunit K